MKLAGRIKRVLAGHSPVALVHAVTSAGHELKMELPAADVVGVVVGDVLVVDWFTIHLDDDDVELRAAAETPPVTASPVTETEPEDPVASVHRMLGRPT